MIQSVKELRPCRLQLQLLSTLAAPKAHHELMQLRPKPDIGMHGETYLHMKLGGDEMKEETYGCDTQVCHKDGYMVGYRVKELDASGIGDNSFMLLQNILVYQLLLQEDMQPTTLDTVMIMVILTCGLYGPITKCLQ